MAASAAAPFPDKTETQMRKRLIIAAVVLLALAGAGGTYGWDWYTEGRFFETTDNATISSDIVAIAPKVPGRIVSLPVSDNQTVRAGDTLMVIDDADTSDTDAATTVSPDPQTSVTSSDSDSSGTTDSTTSSSPNSSPTTNSPSTSNSSTPKDGATKTVDGVDYVYWERFGWIVDKHGGSSGTQMEGGGSSGEHIGSMG